jgi:hypothetical protein
MNDQTRNFFARIGSRHLHQSPADPANEAFNFPQFDLQNDGHRDYSRNAAWGDPQANSGARDGIKDARAKIPTFLWAVTFHGQRRRDLLRSAFASVSNLVAIAILLELISQFLILREIHPGAALLLGPVSIAMPDALARTA